MIRNYLISAWRNLMRRKAFTFINILGLALGMAACLVILKYVGFESSYEQSHTQADRIYRLTTQYFSGGEMRGHGVHTPFQLGPTFQTDYPEVEAYIRFHPQYGGCVISHEDEEGQQKQFFEKDIYYSDSSLMTAFTFPLLYGDPGTAFTQKKSILLSAEASEKYFGKEVNPVGKLLQVDGGWASGAYTVTGVLKDAPQNSHLIFDFLMPMADLLENGQYREASGWGWSNFYTYILVAPGTDMVAFNEKVEEHIHRYDGEGLEERNARNIVIPQPILDIHLYSEVEGEPEPAGNAQAVYFLVLIAIFILIIAWVNYINLSTARAMERAREVGIRKAIGANRAQLIKQFLIESVLVNSFAVLFAVGIALICLPFLGEWIEKPLSVGIQGDPTFWLAAVGMFIFGAFVSGVYPAILLSAFNPVSVLKSGGSSRMAQGGMLRKTLVVFQFIASVVLIAGAFTAYRQLEFLRSSDLGMSMEQVLVLQGPEVLPEEEREQFVNRMQTFLQEVSKFPEVVIASGSESIPGAGHNWGTGMRRVGAPPTENNSGSLVWVDYEFLETYGMEMASGRNFSRDFSTDNEGLLINEAAVRTFGLGDNEQALLEKLVIGGDTVKIIGVIQDFHWSSMKNELDPWLFALTEAGNKYFSLKVETQDLNFTLAKVEETYRNSFPGNPFDYFFADDFFNKMYQEDQKFGKIFSLFTFLAIFVACLGLFGLSSFTAIQRTKEIGIRKVLGASVKDIVLLLSQSFLRLILIAVVIGLPLAWWGVDTWLENYPYRIDLGILFFVLPALAMLALGLLTVIFQTLRAANSNPANSLRSE